jgi:hypothetical protein
MIDRIKVLKCFFTLMNLFMAHGNKQWDVLVGCIYLVVCYSYQVMMKYGLCNYGCVVALFIMNCL